MLHRWAMWPKAMLFLHVFHVVIDCIGVLARGTMMIFKILSIEYNLPVLVNFQLFSVKLLDKSQIGPWWLFFFNLPFRCHCNLTFTKKTGILITGILLLFDYKNYLDLLFLTLFNANRSSPIERQETFSWSKWTSGTQSIRGSNHRCLFVPKDTRTK